MACLTWVRMNPVGVDGFRGGLTVALRRQGTEPIDPDGGGYAGHRCGTDARGRAGACKGEKKKERKDDSFIIGTTVM